MSEFANIENSEGLLKEVTDESPLSAALKRKRKKLAETKLGAETEEETENG